MPKRNPRLRVNPGGALIPAQVVGRDALIARIWRTLQQQSVLLTSERRMGKTSVMRKMEAETPVGICAMRMSLQGIRTPEEFARRLLASIEANAPGVIPKSFVEGLRKSGLKKVAAKPVEVEFEPLGEKAWKDVVAGASAAAEAGIDETVVFLWDELPQMIESIERETAGAGRDVLDLLRFARESHPSIRMVLSGSIGIHHVIGRLREEGGNWAPVHDMAIVDVPPLSSDDAFYLANELLRNERIECNDQNAVARAVVEEVDQVPYYVHHTVNQLQDGQREDGLAIDETRARGAVEAAIVDPLDPWQLKHYLDRVPTYYRARRDLAYVVLDIVAVAPASLSLPEIEHLLGAKIEPPAAGELRDLLELLCKDYYLEAGYCFRLGLVRRAWRARRALR